MQNFNVLAIVYVAEKAGLIESDINTEGRLSHLKVHIVVIYSFFIFSYI